MKVFLAAYYYPPFIASFLKRNPDLDHLSYKEMMIRLKEAYFADTHSAEYWLLQSGISAYMSVINIEVIQRQWARENSLSFKEENWEEEILLAQVKSFKPDVFYTECIHVHSKLFLQSVKNEVKQLSAWVSFPFSSLPTASLFDLILTSTKDYTIKFRAMGIASEYLLPAFDPRIHTKLGELKKTIDFSFVGGISDLHKNRWEALNHLCAHTEIKIWGYGLPPKEANPLKRLFSKDPFQSIRDHHHGEVWGLDMYKILGSSFITFNIHEELLKGDVGNMRMFEASGMGALILNDHGNNINELFEPDKEILTYRTLPEAVEKYNYYIQRKDKVIEMGLNARKRTLEQYNYQNYVISFTNHLKKYLTKS